MRPQDSSSPYRINIAIDIGPDGQPLELPFVIGVIGDFSGRPASPLAALQDRRFVDVDLDNLDEILHGCSPRLTFSVANTLSEDSGNTKLNIELGFRTLDDFSPESVALQVRPLKTLLELRQKLADLRTALQARDGLGELLQETVNDQEKLKQLRKEVRGDTQSAGLQPQKSEVVPASQQPARVARANWKEPATAPEPGIWSTATGPESTSILDQLTVAPRSHTQPERETRRNLIKEFVSEVVDRNGSDFRNVEAMINQRIAQLDHLISVQLNEILHHVDFQCLEASWRGLRFLLWRLRKTSHVKVRVLNVGKKELANQFERERERYTSPVSRRILEEAFAMPGAAAFSLLIGVFDVSHAPGDVNLVDSLARLCAAAHVPFLAAASPDLLGFESFTGLVTAGMLNKTFESPEWSRWNSFRARIESRYIGLVLPSMMMRPPYGRDSHPIEGFNYEEGVDGSDHLKFLWGSGAWALAARFALDFDRYGWCGAPRESGDAGEIRDLPRYRFRAEEGGIRSKGPAEIGIGDKLYLSLRDLGLIPLCEIAETDSAAFYESWSCHKSYIAPDADLPTTYESAQIDCMLDTSRIAHHLHAALYASRQKFANTKECEEYLRKWIAPYVVPDYARGTGFEAAFPLLEADFHLVGAPDLRSKSKLEVSLRPKRPGAPLVGRVEITVELALPWSLTQDQPPQSRVVSRLPATMPTISFESPNSGQCGRDLFIRRLLMAEGSLTSRRLDVAIMILEDLCEQIDRYHLDEWESPRLVTQVWDLLRRCYLLSSPAPEAAERSGALLRRICRLDPARVLE